MMKLDSFFSPYIKINSKRIKYLKVTLQGIKILEEYQANVLFNIILGKIFIVQSPKAITNKNH